MGTTECTFTHKNLPLKVIMFSHKHAQMDLHLTQIMKGKSNGKVNCGACELKGLVQINLMLSNLNSSMLFSKTSVELGLVLKSVKAKTCCYVSHCLKKCIFFYSPITTTRSVLIYTTSDLGYFHTKQLLILKQITKKDCSDTDIRRPKQGKGGSFQP